MCKVKPTQDRARVIPVTQPAIESPVCLIPDRIGACNHKNCMMAFKKPEWFGITIRDFYNTYEFTEFDVITSPYGHPHIIPHNPNPGAGDGFEGFRQSMNAIIHLAGTWPRAATVPREHVEFRWTEHIDSYPATNYETMEAEWKTRPDVAEYAYYVGPLNDKETTEIDVNTVFDMRDQFDAAKGSELIVQAHSEKGEGNG